jgi:hypothetical protein
LIPTERLGACQPSSSYVERRNELSSTEDVRRAAATRMNVVIDRPSSVPRWLLLGEGRAWSRNHRRCASCSSRRTQNDLYTEIEHLVFGSAAPVHRVRLLPGPPGRTGEPPIPTPSPLEYMECLLGTRVVEKA